MQQTSPSALRLLFSLKISRPLATVIMAGAVLLPSLTRAQTYGPNVLPAGNFENVQPTYVPWAGVDAQGNIHGIEGSQWSVGDSGTIAMYKFGPSVAAADLNGDGKPDLVMADSKGYFWLFINSGTPQKPAFTQGEVIPIWLGEARTGASTEGVNNVVPRIQLVDFQGNKKLDVVAGTYAGKLFHVPNLGSSSAPFFKPTLNRDILQINTQRKGVLWCNYLAPFFTTAFATQNEQDLIMGEGTYSANSIYLLHNLNSSGNPAFDEDHRKKIIPGMGLEQLTPAVVDWDNDGKQDVICGDRTGYLNLFLNNSPDPTKPTFAPAVHVKIAGMEKLGAATTVTVADLTGNHLPNLLIGRDDGTVVYALNTGKLGAPVFNTPATPIKGVLPPDYHYTSLNAWTEYQAFGVPDELVAAVNPQLEPGFTFPEGEKSRYALKFFVWPVKNVFFPERFYPPVEDQWNEHVIGCAQGFNLDLNKTYRIHFWIKADRNLSDLRYRLRAGGLNRIGFHGYDVTNPVSVGSSWTEFSSEVRISNPDDPTIKTWSYAFELRFTGQSTFYVDDLQIQQETR
ncbi:MAG TPA: FG-GAP-like repeat-containing protein [Candidatus Methylacidiphilales bacterium]